MQTPPSSPQPTAAEHVLRPRLNTFSSLKKANKHPLSVEAFRLQGKFETLPTDLRAYKNLQSLQLKGNDLERIPEWITEFAQLKYLTISGQILEQTLSQLFSLLGSLTQLEELHLTNLYGYSIDYPEAEARAAKTDSLKNIGQICQLKRLKLPFMALTSLPDEVGDLLQLEHLDISNNALNTLPETIGKCQKLAFLDAYNNQITHLPTSFGQLQELVELQMSVHQMQNADVIAHLPKLQVLNLSNGRLKACPKAMDTLVQMRRLNLANNPIKTIPPVIAQLENLVLLDVSACQLEIVSEEIAKLSNLQYLYCAQNPNLVLSSSIYNMPSLQKLTYDKNIYASKAKQASKHAPKNSLTLADLEQWKLTKDLKKLQQLLRNFTATDNSTEALNYVNILGEITLKLLDDDKLVQAIMPDLFACIERNAENPHFLLTESLKIFNNIAQPAVWQLILEQRADRALPWQVKQLLMDKNEYPKLYKIATDIGKHNEDVVWLKNLKESKDFEDEDDYFHYRWG